MSNPSSCDDLLEAMVIPAGLAREQAHAELEAGQKEGHWIWWVFPTLKCRGGDMFSAQQSPTADLQSIEVAIAYAGHTPAAVFPDG